MVMILEQVEALFVASLPGRFAFVHDLFFEAGGFWMVRGRRNELGAAVLV